MTTTSLRRLAGIRGLRLWKVREGSRDYAEYGPWAIVDANTNGIVGRGFNQEDLEAEIRSHPIP